MAEDDNTYDYMIQLYNGNVSSYFTVVPEFTDRHLDFLARNKATRRIAGDLITNRLLNVPEHESMPTGNSDFFEAERQRAELLQSVLTSAGLRIEIVVPK